MKDYIFEINDHFCIVSAFDKGQAYDLARIYGYKGSINGIRRY
jgi:hypothetical protein